MVKISLSSDPLVSKVSSTFFIITDAYEASHAEIKAAIPHINDVNTS